MNTTAEELFEGLQEIRELAQQPLPDDDEASKSYDALFATSLHEVLVLTCHAGVRDTHQAFGNLFSQVDYLCKRHSITLADRRAIQRMRRHSNHPVRLSGDERIADVHALSILMCAVFSMPGRVETAPAGWGSARVAEPTLRPSIRCIVESWDEQFIVATDGEQTLRISYGDSPYLGDVLAEGMQLNLLFPSGSSLKESVGDDGVLVVENPLVVVEPDFLIDISAIARCFGGYGRHPLLHLLHRMFPREVTQPILLGNFADAALNDIVNREEADVRLTLQENFREKALDFCACQDFNAVQFKNDAALVAAHLAQAVHVLFEESGYHREDAVLEPSFVCEKLGIQGRVDLMTRDMRLLVEQKSGKNWNVEKGIPNAYGSFQREEHYVQLLLYYGVLLYNFGLSSDHCDMRLLYSKYPAEKGLVVVAYYDKLFREIMAFRNQIVAQELAIARDGFSSVYDHMRPETFTPAGPPTKLFTSFLLPRLSNLLNRLHTLDERCRAYYTQMMTFVYREQRISKIGALEGENRSSADWWNMPLSVKRQTGNIYVGLTVLKRERLMAGNGYDTITLHVPEQGADFLSNFRKGDMVFLYSYPEDEEPDVRKNILYKGVLQEIRTDSVTVHLNEGQHVEIYRPDDPDRQVVYAIEHSDSDINVNSSISGLYRFVCAPDDRRALLLGQREPRRDAGVSLSRAYHPDYDEVLLRARQAQDYFLLIGPPGTGKTSMALRFLVEEEQGPMLLLSFTNRAVDEICEMLVSAGKDFLRIGSRYSCAEQFHPYLLEEVLQDTPKLDAIRQRILSAPILVGTTSMLQSRQFILSMKRFSLAIVDEASQILEPNIVGLLADSSIEKFILIGDHKQLPAVVQQNARQSAVDDPLLREICLDNCRQSLFERLLRWERKCGRSDFIGILRKQGRMHPDIAEFPNRMFYAHERLEPVPLPHQEEAAISYQEPSEDTVDDRLKAHRVLFIDTTASAREGSGEAVEAVIVADLLRRIHRFYGAHFDARKTVGVIVPYRSQIASVRRELEKLGIPALQDITIDTVERYQGSQRDVIIYSFTVQKHYQLDFLTANRFEEDGQTIDRKLNVAITRARCQLLMTGNGQILRSDSVFRELLRFTEKRDAVLPATDFFPVSDRCCIFG